MANKTLNTRQKQVFRAPQQTLPLGRGVQQAERGKKVRQRPPDPKPGQPLTKGI